MIRNTALWFPRMRPSKRRVEWRRRGMNYWRGRIGFFFVESVDGVGVLMMQWEIGVLVVQNLIRDVVHYSSVPFRRVSVKGVRES